MFNYQYAGIGVNMVKKFSFLKVLKNLAKVAVSLLAAGFITQDPALVVALTSLFSGILNTIEFFDKQEGK